MAGGAVFKLGSFGNFHFWQNYRIHRVNQRDAGPIFVLGSTAAPAVVRRAPASNTLAAETRKRQAEACNRNRNEHKESQDSGVSMTGIKKEV